MRQITFVLGPPWKRMMVPRDRANIFCYIINDSSVYSLLPNGPSLPHAPSLIAPSVILSNVHYIH